MSLLDDIFFSGASVSMAVFLRLLLHLVFRGGAFGTGNIANGGM